METSADIWGIFRSILHEHFTFGHIKVIAGLGGIDLTRMADLEQIWGSANSASKSRLLSAIDLQVGEMNETRREQFLRIVTEEMLRRKPHIEADFRESLERLGWTLKDGQVVEIAIFDISELPELPADSHGDLLKAVSRLRDGELSGAITAACGAVDTVTSRLYREFGIGDPENATFQEKVNRVFAARDILNEIENQLVELGWEEKDAKVFKKNTGYA